MVHDHSSNIVRPDVEACSVASLFNGVCQSIAGSVRSIGPPFSVVLVSPSKSVTDIENATASRQSTPMLGFAVPCSMATTVPFDRPVLRARASRLRSCAFLSRRTFIDKAPPSWRSAAAASFVAVIILTTAASVYMVNILTAHDGSTGSSGGRSARRAPSPADEQRSWLAGGFRHRAFDSLGASRHAHRNHGNSRRSRH